jgi:hypothetical protein
MNVMFLMTEVECTPLRWIWDVEDKEEEEEVFLV